MRIVLGLEYCGVGFCGWQSQPQGCGAREPELNAMRTRDRMPAELRRALTQIGQARLFRSPRGRVQDLVEALDDAACQATPKTAPLTTLKIAPLSYSGYSGFRKPVPA